MADDRPSPADLTARQKLVLSGLYLSQFDTIGLKRLGFDSFAEAFNVIGYALGAKPASVKNYRDEFDPIFKRRKGWHKRPMREYCREIYEHFTKLDLDEFSGLVESFFGVDPNKPSEGPADGEESDGQSPFAQRLVTGLAAERYFESVRADISIFQNLLLENTTRFGCGYDFRLRRNPDQKDFFAVEVKGLREQSGSVAMTPKEYSAATALKDRFFLFVGRNFRDKPTYTIFQDPISSGLKFTRRETVIVQVSWSAIV